MILAATLLASPVRIWRNMAVVVATLAVLRQAEVG